MKKIGLGIFVAVMVLSVSGVAGAGKLLPAADQAKEKAKVDNSPVIEKTDEHLVLTSPGLERVVFIHYKKGFGRPGTECGNGVCEPGENASKCPADCGSSSGGEESACYAFLGKWVKWQKLPVSYAIDPTNPDGLSENFVTSAISAGAEEWDFWTSSELFNDAYDIIDNGSWDSDAPDGKNELLFGDYPEANVIAVTVIWGYFSGPPGSRKIVEFDILFDTDFTWGDADLDPAVMDLENIATHELGHGVGLADLYDTVCVDETMYGYAKNGEINKRDLEPADITGLQTLYGN